MTGPRLATDWSRVLQSSSARRRAAGLANTSSHSLTPSWRAASRARRPGVPACKARNRSSRARVGWSMQFILGIVVVMVGKRVCCRCMAPVRGDLHRHAPGGRGAVHAGRVLIRTLVRNWR
ncbi:hypothetical protein LHGZ1_1352 [Laribacter hongkongensis]|uniref:Uncharacterized protein n=1 Tax=Laribacter hongkongensis TaxID=168471 RepID=A0A248LJ40_9NEIS|nr:hypothetical protein LHGZ1_1352 [Laribacter hongkongensis]